MNKYVGIAIGIGVFFLWFYNKFFISEKITMKPYSITIDPTFLVTRVRIQILIRNNSDTSIKIDKIAGRIIDDNFETIANFSSNFSTSINKNTSTVMTIYGESKTIDLLQLPDFKKFITKGVISVNGFYIPFSYAVKEYFNEK